MRCCFGEKRRKNLKKMKAFNNKTDQVQLEIKKLQAKIAELKKTEIERDTAYQQLDAINQQLKANEQQLRAANQQLKANEQQLRAVNQQLKANEQQLRAANQQLRASEIELRESKETAEEYLNIAAEIILTLDKNGTLPCSTTTDINCWVIKKEN